MHSKNQPEYSWRILERNTRDSRQIKRRILDIVIDKTATDTGGQRFYPLSRGYNARKLLLLVKQQLAEVACLKHADIVGARRGTNASGKALARIVIVLCFGLCPCPLVCTGFLLRR